MLHKKVYDLPLTLKTKVPNDWKEVKVQQGKSEKVMKSVADRENCYVMYDAMPDGNLVRIMKSK